MNIDDTMTVSELSELIHYDKGTIYRMAREGKLKRLPNLYAVRFDRNYICKKFGLSNTTIIPKKTDSKSVSVADFTTLSERFDRLEEDYERLKMKLCALGESE